MKAPLEMQLHNIDTDEVKLLECYPDKILLDGVEVDDELVVAFLRDLAKYYVKYMEEEG